MGKIYDALEKSKKYPGGNVPEEKTVPLVKLPVETRKKAGQKAPQKILNHGYGKDLIVLSAPDSFEASHFKMLRTNILFANDKGPPRTILITSVLPEEGKTFVCANLAVSFAQGINEHVLLMDCDVRKGRMHSVFGFEDVKAGLNEHLMNDIPLSSLMLKTDIEKLTILPCGTPVNNPSELLSSNKMAQLLSEVRERYNDRFVLIDSAPPNLAPETVAIARHVDDIILVVRCAFTKRELLKDTVDMLGKEKIIGIVLNRIDLSTTKTYAYGKYRKYYSRYKKEGRKS